MDRNKAREGLLNIVDARYREAEALRIEEACYVQNAVTASFMVRKGRLPKPDELTRIADAVQTLMYANGLDSSKEEAAKIRYANDVLNAEFRKQELGTYTPAEQPAVSYSSLLSSQPDLSLSAPSPAPLVSS